MLTSEFHTPASVQPSFIEPMQVLAVRQLPDNGRWTYEAKLDGFRSLVARRKGSPILWSSRGTIFTARFPGIVRACEKLPADTLIDGEIVVVGEDGRCSFNALQYSRPAGHIQLYAFDILIHRGRSVLKLAIEDRRELLTEALRKVQYPVIQSVPFDVTPAELIRAAKELEFEGVIAKRLGSFYEPGKRTGAWLKYNVQQSQEFVIGGYTAGNPFEALIVGCYDGVELRYVGKVSAGFVSHQRCAMMPLFQELATDTCPFEDVPKLYSPSREEMQNCRWVKPLLVAQINFQEWTVDGHLRHASFVGLRSDKSPARRARG